MELAPLIRELCLHVGRGGVVANVESEWVPSCRENRPRGRAFDRLPPWRQPGDGDDEDGADRVRRGGRCANFAAAARCVRLILNRKLIAGRPRSRGRPLFLV